MWKQPVTASKILRLNLTPAKEGPFYKTYQEGELFTKMWFNIVNINSSDFQFVKLHINCKDFILTDNALNYICHFFDNNLNLLPKITHIHFSHIDKLSSLNILKLLGVLIHLFSPISIKLSNINSTQVINTALTMVRENLFITSFTLKNSASNGKTNELLSQCTHLKEVSLDSYTSSFQLMQDLQQKNQSLLELTKKLLRQLEEKNESSANMTMEAENLEASSFEQKKMI